jgi:outer membrane lipoprotein-sorting protein
MACGKKNSQQEITVSVDTSSVPVVAVKIDARKIGPQKSVEQMQIDEAIEKLEANKDQAVVGYWVGAFGKNKINIAVSEVKEGTAIGYTVCAGNFRPVSGTVKIEGDSLFKFEMNEPGTDQYDGHFNFVINTSSKVMNGSWSPFKKGAASAKQFSLSKTAFEYNAEAGELPASSRLLTEEDVSNLDEGELELMRNEIYARHGYSFKNKEMRQRFDTTSWYIPMGIDIRDKLTDTEVTNIDLIYRYEEYLAENYDSYGR